MVQYFWQTYCDKKEGDAAFVTIEDDSLKTSDDAPSVPLYYAILPLLPLLLIVAVGIAGIFMEGITMDIFVLTMISFFIALIIETIRKRSFLSLIHI